MMKSMLHAAFACVLLGMGGADAQTVTTAPLPQGRLCDVNPEIVALTFIPTRTPGLAHISFLIHNRGRNAWRSQPGKQMAGLWLYDHTGRPIREIATVSMTANAEGGTLMATYSSPTPVYNARFRHGVGLGIRYSGTAQSGGHDCESDSFARGNSMRIGGQQVWDFLMTRYASPETHSLTFVPSRSGVWGVVQGHPDALRP